MTDKIIVVGGGKDGLVSAVNQVMKDGKHHHLIISNDKKYIDREEVGMRENPVFIEDELNKKSPKQTMRERLYKHITIEKCRVNAPKRQPCSKCQSQARRVRKVESTNNMPAMAFYKCRCKNRFEIVLKRQ